MQAGSDSTACALLNHPNVRAANVTTTRAIVLSAVEKGFCNVLKRMRDLFGMAAFVEPGSKRRSLKLLPLYKAILQDNVVMAKLCYAETFAKKPCLLEFAIKSNSAQMIDWFMCTRGTALSEDARQQLTTASADTQRTVIGCERWQRRADFFRLVIRNRETLTRQTASTPPPPKRLRSATCLLTTSALVQDSELDRRGQALRCVNVWAGMIAMFL